MHITRVIHFKFSLLHIKLNGVQFDKSLIDNGMGEIMTGIQIQVSIILLVALLTGLLMPTNEPNQLSNSFHLCNLAGVNLTVPQVGQ